MKKFPLILAVMTFLLNAECSAEDLRFIDAIEDSGYYYDADSVNTINKDAFTVKMAIIKANLNCLYSYDVKIIPAKRSYEILSSKVLSYDTRALLRSDDTPRYPQRYAAKSEFGQMVQLILNGE